MVAEAFKTEFEALLDPANSFTQIHSVFGKHKSWTRWWMKKDIRTKNDWRAPERYQRTVLRPLFLKRVIALATTCKTCDEVLKIYFELPFDTGQDQVIARALELADFKNTVFICKRLRHGSMQEKALKQAAKLAKTREQIWEVAVLAHGRDEELWKKEVKKLSSKL